ncbi:hypothetical protein ACFYOV_18640 [Streptomyces sp. NPDC005931]
MQPIVVIDHLLFRPGRWGRGRAAPEAVAPVVRGDPGAAVTA